MSSFRVTLRTGLQTALVVIAAAASASAGEPAAFADNSPTAGWDWLATTKKIQTEGVVWNDQFGDGKDRWKTGGLTQSYVFPEHIFSDDNWFEGRASSLELNLRAVVMTPDDTAFDGVNGKDRPYAQYAAAGVYLRSIARPRFLSPTLSLQEEARIGVEVGWQGDPLPLFDVQNGLHHIAGMDGDAANLSNIIDGELLVNLEGRHTWRYHWDRGDRDLEFAPFVQGSLGMRETSLRVGADLFTGSALDGRTWGADPATGAVMAGASIPRRGFNWTVFVGGDVGYVASDAFLDGGFAVNGPSVPRERIVGRLRTGLLLEYDNVGIGFSVNWLSPEFRDQSEGQVIGAIQLKYRF
jgi:hypothetical protein